MSRILTAVPRIHETLGAVLIAINLVAGGWGLLIYRDRLRSGRAFEQVLALSHTIVVGQALVGLLLLGSNRRAPVQLHYVYGAVPAVLVLFGYSSRTDDPRRNVLVFAIVALLVAALGARAFMTGKGWG